MYKKFKLSKNSQVIQIKFQNMYFFKQYTEVFMHVSE